MASRRNRRDAQSAFDHGQEYSLEDVDNALFGGLQRADAERVIIRPVAVDSILIDEAIQVRVGGLDPETVENYVQVLINGGAFEDPIKVCRDENGQLWLADGFHRTEATIQALARADDPRDVAQLRAEIHPGGRERALTLAEEGNLTHGKALSRKDKLAIFRRRLKRGHEWAQWSNRAIAAVLGVDEGTIRNWLKKMTAENSAVERPETRIGKDGRAIDTSGISEATRESAQESDPPTPNQNNSDTKIDSDTGNVSSEEPAVVHEYLVLKAQLTAVGDAASKLMQIQPAMMAGRLTPEQVRELHDYLIDVLDWLTGYEDSYEEWQIGLVDHLNGLLSWVEREQDG